MVGLKFRCIASGWDPPCGRLDVIAAESMEHYSFQGPYAYRWLNDVPVERIHLRNGERRQIRIGDRRLVPPPAAEARSPIDGVTQAAGLRARMAAWN